MAETRTDSIFLTSLALHACHGVMPHERKVGQSFKIDIVRSPARETTEASPRFGWAGVRPLASNVSPTLGCRRRGV